MFPEGKKKSVISLGHSSGKAGTVPLFGFFFLYCDTWTYEWCYNAMNIECFFSVQIRKNQCHIDTDSNWLQHKKMFCCFY